MKLRGLQDIKVAGKRVLVRTGFDVSVKNQKVEDFFRLRSALPTLDYLVKNRAKIIILTHRGRPQGWDENLSLEPVATEFAHLLRRKLVVVPAHTRKLPEYDIPHLYFFRHNLERDDATGLAGELREKDIAVLENLRFYPGEKANDQEFVQKLAELGEIYVNDAFSVSHRAHASVTGIPKFLPTVAGLGLLKEISALERVLSRPQKPVTVLMGGVKLSDKAPALENLLKFSDSVLLGGGLANLFLKTRGFEVGKSVYEEEASLEKLARQLWRDFQEKIKLPLDVVVSTSREGQAECLKVEKVKPHHIILDIGPETIRLYSGYLKAGRTLIWGGPMGYFENKSFSHGTFALAWLFAARSASPKIYGVAGGGQTLEVIEKLKLQDQIDYVSTGGGAMLDFLAGKSLPGIVELEK